MVSRFPFTYPNHRLGSARPAAAEFQGGRLSHSMPDYELKAAVAKIKAGRFNFGLYRGTKADQVLVTPGPAKEKLIDEIEKECGEVKCMAKGLCFFEGEQLVFGVRADPVPEWEKKITAVFKKQACTKYLPIVLRKLRANEPDRVEGQEAEGEESQPPILPPQSRGAPSGGAEGPLPDAGDLRVKWQQVKGAVMPRVSAGVQANPAIKAEIIRLLKVASEAEKAENFSGAIEAFREIVKLLATAPTPAPKAVGPTAEALAAEIRQLAAAIKEAIANQPERKEEILRPVAAFQAQLKAGELDAAAASLRAVRALLEPAPSTNGAAPAMQAWKTARAAALEQLKQLTAAVKGSGDPEADAAIILLRAIQANLTAEPDTPQKIAELERYLQTDDIITEAEAPNGFGLRVELKAPLLASLRQLASSMQPAGAAA
jgi:hypothetical protein